MIVDHARLNVVGILILHAPDAWGLVGGLIWGLGVAMAVLYRPQTRGLRRPWCIALPALRILALAALAILLLRPALRTQRQGAVVVLLDRSGAMSVRAAQGTIPQRVALADALDDLPGTLIRPRVNNLLAKVGEMHGILEEMARSRNEVEYAELSLRDAAPASKRLMEATARFQIASNSLSQRDLATTRSAGRSAGSLAEAIGLLVDLARSGVPEPKVSADAWIQNARSRLDRVNSAASVLQASLDDELYRGSETLRQECIRLAVQSRLELEERALTAPRSGVLPHIPAGSEVYAFTFAGAADRGGVTPLAVRNGQRPITGLALEADGPGGDVAVAIRTALSELHGVPVAAVAVLSQGHADGGGQPFSYPNGIPVFAAGLWPPGGSRELALLRINAPAALAPGQTAPASILLRGSGLKGLMVPVRVRLDSAVLPAGPPPTGLPAAVPASLPATAPVPLLTSSAPVLETTATFGDSDIAEAHFLLRLDGVAEHRLVASIAAVLPGDVVVQRDEGEIWAKLLPQPTQVALFCDILDGDYRYLRDVLAGMPGVELRDGVLAGGKLPLSPAQILDEDLIILCDVAAAAMDPAQAQALHDAVAQRGAGMILAAGPRHLPAEYQGPLEMLLPFVAGDRAIWQVWPGQDPYYRFSPASSLAARELCRLDDKAAISRQRWDELPAVFCSLAMPPLKPAAQALLWDRQSHAPVVTALAVGRGKSLLVGLNETWRWRDKNGGRDADRLWMQWVRWAVGEPYLSGGGALRLDVSRASVMEGRGALVRARLLTDSHEPPLAELPVRVERVGGAQSMLMLKRIDDGGGFEATAMLPVGDYILHADGGAATAAIGPAVECGLHVLPLVPADLADSAAGYDSLKRLAQASGGNVYSLEDIDAMTADLAAVVRQSHYAQETPLWQSLYTFAFIAACFTAEWALRKSVGLG